ncbi:MAG: ATP-binding protein [Chloroflexota bacterium]
MNWLRDSRPSGGRGPGSLAVVAILAAGVGVGAQVVLPATDVTAVAIFFTTAAVATAIAVAAAWRGRAGLPRAWWLVVTAMAINVAIDLVQLLQAIAGGPVVDENLLGSAYLLPYLVLTVGIFDLVRVQPAGFDRAALLDAAIIVLGFGLGTFLVATALVIPAELATLELQVTVAATFAVGLPPLTIGLWLAMIGGPPRPAAALLLAAVAVQSAGDSMFGLGLANSSLVLPREAAWLAALVLLGGATVVGSSRRLEAPASPLLRDPLRIWLLGLAIAAPAVAGLEAYLTDLSRELISILILVVAGMAIVRITYLLRQVNRLAADTAAYRDLSAALERARADYQDLVDASPGTSWTSRILDAATGASGRLYVSPQIATLTGYAADEFQSGTRRWRDVMHPDDRTEVSDRYQARMRDLAAGRLPAGVSYVDEYRIQTSDGRTKWVRDTHHYVRDATGGSGTIHGLVLDITEQRLAEDKIRASEARFRTLVEQLPGVVVLREVDDGAPGRIVYVSPSSARIIGLSPDEIASPSTQWAMLIEPDDLDAVLNARDRHLATGDRTEVVARLAARPGYPGIARWVEITWVRVQELGPRQWLSLGVLLDVSSLREAEAELRAVNAALEDRIEVRTAELRAAQLEAERASRAKSEFLSSMSHELRTPLNAILGFGQLLQLAPLAGPDRESADEIVRAGRNLLEMIEAVLELSRLDAGRITLSIEPVELGPLVRETIDLCRPGASEHDVTVVDDLAAEPTVVVLADRRRLGQILLNLVTNGIKYNVPGGRVTLSAEASGDRARIRVRDTGVGIPPERLPRLFEPFETMRGDHAARQSLGLGLALSQRLAELMGGSLRATSRLGTGSEFELDMPLAIDSMALTAGDDAPPEPPVRAARTVLYIEDNLANLHLVERVLAGRFGARVLAAIQGRMGLELAREHRPDLVLLDLHLPDVEPGEILGELTSDERTRAIPVVVLSSDASLRTEREMRRLGATDYLTKPLDIARFLEVVEHLLETEERHDPGT